MSIELNKKQKFLKFLFYVMPHHAVSRVVYLITRLHGPQVQPMIRWFVQRYGVNMDDAEESEIGYYQTFNEFFTRELKHNIRPVVSGDNTLACPCDGKISQAGPIRAGAIMQAKGRAYSALELLGGDLVDELRRRGRRSSRPPGRGPRGRPPPGPRPARRRRPGAPSHGQRLVAIPAGCDLRGR